MTTKRGRGVVQRSRSGASGCRKRSPLLQQALGDAEFEVRQMVAFALGLIGDASARPALLNALKDSEPIVQGRAAEALGTIGDRSDAPAIAAMVKTWVQGGALNTVAPDDLTWPLAPPVEAVRLGLYALVRLGSYEGIATSVVNTNGAPVSAWWPVAFALGRSGDARAVPALTVLLATPGRFTAAFAARGLGALKAQNAAPALRDIVDKRQRDPAVVIEAMRALAAMGDMPSRRVLERVVAESETDSTLRLEAANALAGLHAPESLDFILDLMSDPAPSIRGAAIRALAAIDSETFLTTLSGMDPDRDWTVRTAQADALALLPGAQGQSRLVAMLQDRDQRVIPAVLRALVAAKSPDAERILTDRLKADDFVVRVAAANGLASLKAKSAIPALANAYQAAGGRHHLCGSRRHAGRGEHDRPGRRAGAAASRAAGQGLGGSRQSRHAIPRSGNSPTARPRFDRRLSVRWTRPHARRSWRRSSRRTRLSSWIAGRSSSNWRLPMRRSPSPTSSSWRARIFSTGSPFIALCPISSSRTATREAMERAGRATRSATN
jgi:HEAT repeat protein